MSAFARRAPAYLLSSIALFVLAAFALEGCGQGSSREQEYLKNNPTAKEQPAVGKFSGRVTVDGATQIGKDQLFVLLIDPQHPETPPISTRCKPDGSFEFMTYFPGDGVPLGKYIVGFVALHPGKASGGGTADAAIRYRGPDGLKNLYNDPDKNKDIKEFVVEVTQPGRTDYEFNLAVAGKDAATPGAHAVKTLGSGQANL